MSYVNRLKVLFDGADLNIRDLLLLEAYQLNYLPERLPQKEFAEILKAYPEIHYFMVNKQPGIKRYVENILEKYAPAADKEELAEYCDQMVWEIAEMLVYVKYPELYDSRVKFSWDFQGAKGPTNPVWISNSALVFFEVDVNNLPTGSDLNKKPFIIEWKNEKWNLPRMLK